ncbi:MAG TPA: cytidylate kinase family protein, partial [Sumerlaeia bacterium]|nr:cytidylate kinase family protein [Sumerlaeia bacterium]
VAESANVRRRLIDRMDQRRRSYVRSVVEGMLRERWVDHVEYCSHLLEVLNVFVQEGGCILLGRGAPFVVWEGAGIRVALVAPREKRVKSLMHFYNIDAREAEKRMVTSDRERAQFARMCFQKDIGDVDHYDLVINLERIKPKMAAAIILRAMEVMRSDRKEQLTLLPGDRDAEEVLDRQIGKWERDTVVERREMWAEEAEEELPPRRLPVVAFSRKLGSGARLVAEALHSRLGYEVFGYRLIDRVAEDSKLSERVVDRLDRAAESAIEAMIGSLVGRRRLDREDYFRSLVRVVRALIVQGGVIFLGRGSVFLVKEREGLRVRLTAPFEKRLERIKEYEGLEGKTAQEKLLKGDKDRAYFDRYYFKADLEDPTHFDLIINTERIAPVSATDIVLRALEPFQV